MILFFQEGCLICDLVEKAINALHIKIDIIRVPFNTFVHGIPAFPALYLHNTVYVGEGIVSVLKQEVGNTDV